jgi:hypothetical protein
MPFIHACDTSPRLITEDKANYQRCPFTTILLANLNTLEYETLAINRNSFAASLLAFVNRAKA